MSKNKPFYTGKAGYDETRAGHDTLQEARDRLDYVENNVDSEGMKTGCWYLEADLSQSSDTIVTKYTEDELIKAVTDQLRSMSDGEDLACAVQSLWGCVDIQFVGDGQYEVHE